MNDLLRSLILLAGIGAGLLSGYATGSGGQSGSPQAGAVAAAIRANEEVTARERMAKKFSGDSAESAIASPKGSPAMLDKMAGWWQRALLAGSGDGEALILEMERETGTSLLPTATVILAERDPEGCLRALLKLQRLNLGGNTTLLFNRWAMHDSDSALRALPLLPSRSERNRARAAIEAGLEQKAHFLKGDSAKEEESREPEKDFTIVAEATREIEAGSDQNLSRLEALPSETLREGIGWWLHAAIKANPERAAVLVAKVGEDARRKVRELALKDFQNDALFKLAISVHSPEDCLELRQMRAECLAGIRSDAENLRNARSLPLGSPERIGIIRKSVNRFERGSAEARKLASTSSPGELLPDEFRHAAYPENSHGKLEGLTWLAAQSLPAARAALLSDLPNVSESMAAELITTLPAGGTRDACIRRWAVQKAGFAWLRSLTDEDYATAAAAIRADITRPPQIHEASLRMLDALEE